VTRVHHSLIFFSVNSPEPKSFLELSAQRLARRLGAEPGGKTSCRPFGSFSNVECCVEPLQSRKRLGRRGALLPVSSTGTTSAAMLGLGRVCIRSNAQFRPRGLRVLIFGVLLESKVGIRQDTGINDGPDSSSALVIGNNGAHELEVVFLFLLVSGETLRHDGTSNTGEQIITRLRLLAMVSDIVSLIRFSEE